MLWPMLVRSVLASMTACLAGACTAPATEADFDSAVPAARLQAIERAAVQRDETATIQLLEQLDSDDPAVRMLALEALKRLDDDTHGYWFADPPYERRAAIERWTESVSRQRSPAAPAPGPATDDDG
jgi:hypothetical protein